MDTNVPGLLAASELLPLATLSLLTQDQAVKERVQVLMDANNAVLANIAKLQDQEKKNQAILDAAEVKQRAADNFNATIEARAKDLAQQQLNVETVARNLEDERKRLADQQAQIEAARVAGEGELTALRHTWQERKDALDVRSVELDKREAAIGPREQAAAMIESRHEMVQAVLAGTTTVPLPASDAQGVGSSP